MAISTDIKKNELIEALQKSLGIVTSACKEVGVDRQTYYNWLNDDPIFAKRVEDLKDVAIDFAESSLFKQIQSGVPSSTMFYLKTKAKHRGYIERTDNFNVNYNVGTKDLDKLEGSQLDDEIKRIEEAINLKEK